MRQLFCQLLDNDVDLNIKVMLQNNILKYNKKKFEINSIEIHSFMDYVGCPLYFGIREQKQIHYTHLQAFEPIVEALLPFWLWYS